MITASQLRVSRGPRLALDGVALDLGAGEMIALIGLNGAGKSTLLETIAGVLPGYAGQCRVDGREISEWKPRQLAQRIAFLPQSAGRRSGISARQVVFMGRYPHSPGWQESPEDSAAVERAMRDAACWPLAARSFATLSGGERQRVLLAAVLAQEAPVLLLDEPAAHVDLPHQIEMYRLLRRQAAHGVLCVAATHDLNLAAAFATRILLLHEGKVAAFGAPPDVFGGEAFRRVFGPEFEVRRQGAGVQITYQTGGAEA